VVFQTGFSVVDRCSCPRSRWQIVTVASRVVGFAEADLDGIQEVKKA